MRKNQPRFYRKPFFASAAALVGLIIILGLLELTNTTHIFHKAKVPAVIPSHSNSAGSNDSSATANTVSPNSSSRPSATAPANSDITNHDLVAPTGNFVSNHFPGQNGSPTAEASTCNTSPGAECYIKFTNIDTGETTQLTAQATDAHGSTSWYWDTAKDAHLTSGQWKITAVATLGSQTKSSDDALKLTVQ